MDKLDVTRVCSKFCNEFLPTELPTFFAIKLCDGKVYNPQEVQAIKDFISHLQSAWNSKLEEIEKGL